MTPPPRPVTSVAPSQVLPRDEQDRFVLAVPDGVRCRVEGNGRVEVGKAAVELGTGGPYRIEIDVDAAGTVSAVDDVFVGDVWALAGQSNMAGAGELSPPPQPEPLARALGFDGRWGPAVEPLHRLWLDGDTVLSRATRRIFYPEFPDDEWQSLLDRAEEVEGPRVGPGVAFARAMTAATGVPVGLLPCALGATSLDLWMPDAEPGVPRDATLYGNLVSRATSYGPVRGLLWHQGEGDSGPGLGSTYCERFTAFVAALRSDLGLASLPVVAAQIGRYDLAQLKAVLDLDVDPADVPEWDAVRDGVRRAADGDPLLDVVATADLQLVDGIHLSRVGQETLGARLAAVALALGHVEPKLGRRPPRLISVAAAAGGPDRDRAQVTCTFGDVVEGITFAGASDFRLAPGDVAPTEVHAQRDRVVLTFDRPLPPNATLTYGPGINPDVGLVDGLLPLPLFGPVAISGTDPS